MGKYSDEGTKAFTEKIKNQIAYCVYCGEIADTREHTPSKIFIDTPYPEEYPIVPACFKCNNGFSEAELYTSCFVDKLRNALSNNQIPLRSKTVAALEHDMRLARIMDDNIRKKNENFFINWNEEYLQETLIKLAKGHICNKMDSVFTLEHPSKLDYCFVPDMNEQALADFNTLPLIDMTGEVGSNFSHEILAIENKDTGEINTIVPWEVFQENQYRFMVYFENNNYIAKIVINELLLAVVTFAIEELSTK